jgi:trafficking protein particle complex subunit 6
MTTLPSLSTAPPPAPAGSSDPLSSFLSTTCMDLLLIELVPLAKRLSSNPLPLTDDTFLDLNPPGTADLDDDSARESMYFRLEPLGFRVGQGIAER